MTDPTPTQSTPLDARAKSTFKAVFITLFLDLVGFSIIFPLFPAMLDYYVAREGNAPLLGGLVEALQRFSEAAGAPGETGLIVLFGGVLASLYSLLQFFFSPIIGTLSDRFGRKPLLLISIAGIALSYVLWFFAESFAVLVLARLIGGMMAGNISTASAAVADVTSVRDRPRGMAVIGIAFGLGFIFGPAIGGASVLLDLPANFPALAGYGVNPFSTPALVAFALSVINLAYVALFLEETLKPATRDAERPSRTINPVALFSTSAYPGVTNTNFSNFFFLTAFSGAEFGLTFLAMERLAYGPQQNAMLFVFVGVVLALVQGGYVRRRAPVIGPKRMAVHGFIIVAPGVLLLAFAKTPLGVYAALFLMAVGSAQIIPCLSSLASGFAPAHEQGRILGVFRSLGALARGVGPLIACLLYWRLGSMAAYALLAAAMIWPLALVWLLPPLPGSTDSRR